MNPAVSEVQVRRIEVGEVREPLEIVHEKATAMMVDEAGLAKLLKSAVDMHARQPERVAEHFLRQRHFTAVAFDQPSRA